MTIAINTHVSWFATKQKKIKGRYYSTHPERFAFVPQTNEITRATHTYAEHEYQYMQGDGSSTICEPLERSSERFRPKRKQLPAQKRYIKEGLANSTVESEPRTEITDCL